MDIPFNHNRISLVSCAIPKSFLLVNSPANTFKLDATTYTIPVGNYSIESFLTEVNSQITPDTIAFSSLTGKITLTSTASELIFPATSKLHKLFGFDAGSTNAISTTLTSDHIVNFQSLTHVRVICDVVSHRGHGSNVLHTFYTNTAPDFSVIFYENPQIHELGKIMTNTHSEDDDKMITHEIGFKLLDGDGNVVNLNGLDWELCVKTWREPGDIYPMLKAYFRIKLAYLQEKRTEKMLEEEISKKN